MKHLKRILIATSIIGIGLVIFKLIPMKIFGNDILFDASAHLSIAMLILYIFWFFIDQTKSLRLPYLMISMVILSIISFQRIIDNAHNDVGLLEGFIIGLIAITIAEYDKLKKYINW